MKRFLLSFTIIILSACEDKWGNYGGYRLDYSSKMEYYIILDKEDTILQDYPYYNKGCFLKYHDAYNKVDSGFVSSGAKVIDAFIDEENVIYDSTYILVAQKPLDHIFGKIKLEPYPHRERELSLDEIERCKYYKFWIINKLKNDIYGPFDHTSYLMKKKELKIPNKLKLNVE